MILGESLRNEIMASKSGKIRSWERVGIEERQQVRTSVKFHSFSLFFGKTFGKQLRSLEFRILVSRYGLLVIFVFSGFVGNQHFINRMSCFPRRDKGEPILKMRSS